MPRFFFDSSHAHEYRRDTTGSEFASAEEALADAQAAASELKAALTMHNVSLEDRAIIVRDGKDRIIGAVELDTANRRVVN